MGIENQGNVTMHGNSAGQGAWRFSGCPPGQSQGGLTASKDAYGFNDNIAARVRRHGARPAPSCTVRASGARLYSAPFQRDVGAYQGEAASQDNGTFLARDFFIRSSSG